MLRAATPPFARQFLAAFVGVAISFIASSIYSQVVQVSIDRDAISIAGNAAPSVEHLSKSRAELRRLQVILERDIADGQLDQLPAASEALGAFRKEVAAYRALPTYPGEEALWSAVGRDVAALDAIVAQILQRCAQGGASPAEIAALERELPGAADRADASISLSVEFNAEHARALAEAIERTRRRSMVLEGGLDALSAIFSMALGFLLLRVVRHYTGILVAHGALLEQRSEELEQFAGRVAHDILSPLGSTAFALSLAAKELPPEARAQTGVARGQRSLARVQRIVDGLLEFARGGARPVPGARADMAAIVSDVVAGVQGEAEERDITLTAELGSGGVVACSPGVLTSMIANLVRNAVKYMGDRDERSVHVRVIELKAAVRVEVTDTGPGIPEEALDGIFQPYVRGKDAAQPGIGLGLATVKRIAETHGGRVGVVSSPGVGSRFWFELPKAPEPPAPPSG